MKKILIIFSIIIALTSCSKEDSVVEEINNNLISAKVVGYLPWYRFSQNDKIEYCKITHLNIAFANPESDGTIHLPNNSSGITLENIISTAKSKNNRIKIYISLAGGSIQSPLLERWKNFLASSQERSVIVNKIISFVIDNNLDGVDVDLEWDAVTVGYSDFVIELKSALKSKGKGMTAAFPGETRFSNISDEALQTFDFINIMAYDYTGPWNPSKPGQHSSYQNAESSVNFWKNIGVSGDKLTLGVPFYGYDFSNSSNVTAFTFGEMVSTNNSYSEIDNVGMKYYNGRQTIKSKVKLASEQVSGIMIWELGQDSFNEYSLLKTIQKEYGILGFKTTSLCGN
tara:strand:- start:13313 stop:14338 length:1026 start_codon:yes stop_codon:yes gene_type:complete